MYRETLKSLSEGGASIDELALKREEFTKELHEYHQVRNLSHFLPLSFPPLCPSLPLSLPLSSIACLHVHVHVRQNFIIFYINRSIIQSAVQ